MINFYTGKITTYIDGKEFYSEAIRTMQRNVPEDKEIKLTWESLSDFYGKNWLYLPFTVLTRKKGIIISFRLECLGERSIKQWETPDLPIAIKYHSWRKISPSIREILNYRDGDMAIKYLADRWMNYEEKAGRG